MADHKNLAAALVAALAELSVVEKHRMAKIESKTGRDYSYEYADLGDVVKLTRPKLAEHGLVALTPVEEHGTGLKVTVVLLHSSGERMDFGPFPFPHGQTAQATGSMVTYYRRYALVAALGMAAGDDDDGATAVAAPPRQEPRPLPAGWSSQDELDQAMQEYVETVAAENVPAKVKDDLKEWRAEQGFPWPFEREQLDLAYAEFWRLIAADSKDVKTETAA